MERAGYKVVTPTTICSISEASAADYQVAAVITDEHIDGCVSHGGMLSCREWATPAATAR